MPFVELPDGGRHEVPAGTTLAAVAERLAPALARRAVAVWLDDELVDLARAVEGDARVRFVTTADPEGLEVFRHSSAHLLAEAVVSLFPDAKPTIGPVVEEGFYYDFDHAPFSEEDLGRIEARMREIAAAGRPLRRRELGREEALALFAGNPYKLEMIHEMPAGETISVYDQGGAFVDLCRGPHLPDLGRIRAFKLTKLAGAYWRADVRNPMLQRVYGISFEDPKALAAHLKALEEAKRRDHRRIGKELDLFSFHEEGQGFAFWHAKGAIVFNELSAYIREECRRRGYVEVRTPMILNQELWLRSGHWDHYAEAMYFVDIDQKPHAVKPMNCPGGLLVYRSRLRSYRDLPIRQAELGMVHRNELSGVLHGLFRVRAFTQDDAHVFCTEDQLNDEVVKLIRFCIDVYRTFGFPDPEIKLSTQPTDHIGDEAIWTLATEALRAGLAAIGLPHKVAPGEGAFYGPKIDFDIRDSLGRRWQCGTVQVDFSMPERFDLTYEGADGRPHRPVMLHRAILGSLERFIGVLIEHTAGRLPLWISPVQARVIPVGPAHQDYARSVAAGMEAAGLRVEVDAREETLGKRVRAAQVEQVNYILVVGDREAEAGTVNVRTRDNVVHGPAAPAELTARLREEIAARALG
ncbi:MAG: threonine--tRNA ligase [Candidatus Eisenbacteria bacterium]|uniref:Threonine--tRNA ligase n=1 Tax=Eiseniibacteriota bacterium TaxID=2212470 RepID=A0A938BPW3_UNCEI|nr:threonine--tRNA ligase [Candidatus Eisenbacteria bacterium]